MLPSNAGYSEEADELFKRYETLDAGTLHAPWAQFFPVPPARVLDIGAGTGRDAAWFASQGYNVLAVEPTDAMRERAKKLHPDPAITWMNDILPKISHVRDLNQTFDLILMHAVWMHLTETERSHGMQTVSGLLETGGRIAMSLRHGKVPVGRRMFDVSGAETIALAKQSGLTCLEQSRVKSMQAGNHSEGVEWTKLVLEKT